ncbi:MAG: trans-aconitate 2-methyltransferase [Planctomycetota bacterium]
MLGRFGSWWHYLRRMRRERALFGADRPVHALPPIFHHWSHTFVRPMLRELGGGSPEEFFAHWLRRAAAAAPGAVRFLSLGSGAGESELAVAERLRAGGLESFRLVCVDQNPALVRAGAAAAGRRGLAGHVEFRRGDLNRWRDAGRYDALLANQSLHHLVELERLFDWARAALLPHGVLVISDMIGRNGHMRWPEARAEVERFWAELPPTHRFNHQTRTAAPEFVDFDCAGDGFEGVRAQDVLPLLLERFEVQAFAGFANVIDVFVDRGYGPNFDVGRAADRAFVDRVHARDEELLRGGAITPTHMFAVLRTGAVAAPVFARGLAPRSCVRRA